jgi:hypothetical protein
MFFSAHPTRGRCPLGGTHDGGKSGNYNLLLGS